MALKVGIIGTGIFARNAHLPALQAQSGELQVHACTNRTRSKAETFAAAAGIPPERVFSTPDELLRSGGVDFVDALVPVSSNLDMVQRALGAGTPIAFEKPIAHNLHDAREIVRIASASALPVIVLENMCYYNCIPVLREHLPAIGRVLNFVYYAENPFNPGSPYLQTAWRQQPDHVGGYLSDGGVHQIALLTEVLGDVARVAAFTAQGREIAGGPDTMNAILKMRSGAQGTFVFALSGCQPRRSEFAIFGDKGSLVYDWSERDAKKVTLYRGGDGGEQVFPLAGDLHDGVYAEFANFHDALRKKDKNVIVATPARAFHHFAVIVACIQSAEQEGTSIAVETVE